MSVLNIAILGTGNIGCDLLRKITLSNKLNCIKFIGRNIHSDGIKYAKELGISTSTEGIDALIKDINRCDLIFDATSAIDHIRHATLIKKYRKKIINLTPAKIGIDCVPAVNIGASLVANNLNLVTCGGQASIPVIMSVKNSGCEMNYVEVVSSISASSAGAATRINIHEYLEKTEKAIKNFTGCSSAKAILNINPAIPHVNMQTTIYILSRQYNALQIIKNVNQMVDQVRSYMSGYELIGNVQFDGEKITILLRLTGAGHYLPSYAGNLDIITSAAVNIGEYLSMSNSGRKYA